MIEIGCNHKYTEKLKKKNIQTKFHLLHLNSFLALNEDATKSSVAVSISYRNKIKTIRQWQLKVD